MPEKKRNIVIAAEIFPPDIGGPATYASHLAEYLQSAGWHVRVITYGEIKKEYSYPVAYIPRAIPFGLRQVVYFFKLIIIGWRSCIIYAQGPSVAPAALILSWIRPVSVVVKYVGDQSWQQLRVKGSRVAFEEYMHTYGKKFWNIKIWWIERWQRFALMRAHYGVVPSNYLRYVLTRYFSMPTEKITVIPNGVIEQQELTSHTHAKTILYSGRVENWKGIETLLSALVLLPQWKLTILGAGSMEQEYKKKVQQLGISSRVVFVKPLPHKGLRSFYAQFFCLVLASEYEGMPHTILEAWSYGLPVVVSNFPANTELVEDGITGMVFTLNNAQNLAEVLKKLEQNKQLYARIRAYAFKAHKEFSYEKTMRETSSFLANISR